MKVMKQGSYSPTSLLEILSTAGNISLLGNMPYELILGALKAKISNKSRIFPYWKYIPLEICLLECSESSSMVNIKTSFEYSS